MPAINAAAGFTVREYGPNVVSNWNACDGSSSSDSEDSSESEREFERALSRAQKRRHAPRLSIARTTRIGNNILPIVRSDHRDETFHLKEDVLSWIKTIRRLSFIVGSISDHIEEQIGNETEGERGTIWICDVDIDSHSASLSRIFQDLEDKKEDIKNILMDLPDSERDRYDLGQVPSILTRIMDRIFDSTDSLLATRALLKRDRYNVFLELYECLSDGQMTKDLEIMTEIFRKKLPDMTRSKWTEEWTKQTCIQDVCAEGENEETCEICMTNRKNVEIRGCYCKRALTCSSCIFTHYFEAIETRRHPRCPFCRKIFSVRDVARFADVDRMEPEEFGSRTTYKRPAKESSCEGEMRVSKKNKI